MAVAAATYTSTAAGALADPIMSQFALALHSSRTALRITSTSSIPGATGTAVVLAVWLEYSAHWCSFVSLP